ncbi:hypothetical protein HZA87_00885 [Candidatus Uhrbacteria bacterium]|nr:hypothetical protein [Candidatus Uhrbacteria bacterium]
MSKLLLCAVLALSTVWPRVALATCPVPTTLVDLTRSELAAEKAFTDADETLLLTSSTLARTNILPCLAEPLSVSAAAGFHRLMALEAYFNGDEGRTVAEFHAARKLDPGYQFSTDMVDLNHPMRALYESAATVADGDAEPVYPPSGGYILVAGVRNAARYKATPVVIQVFGPGGVLMETRYVEPGEALPKWSDNPLGLTAADLGIKQSVLKDPRPWYIAAGVSALTGGILYAFAMNERSLFQDPATSDDDLLGHQENANALGTASIVAAGTTLVFTGFGVGFQFGAHKPPTLSMEALSHAP